MSNYNERLVLSRVSEATSRLVAMEWKVAPPVFSIPNNITGKMAIGST